MDEKQPNINWFELDKEELQFLGDAAGFETVVVSDDEALDSAVGEIVAPRPNAGEIIKALSTVAITEGPEAFCAFVVEHREEVYAAAFFDEDVIRALLVGYKLGIDQKSGACANDLGAMYYAGEIVEQDYAKAAQLYEMAIGWGCEQSIINMGYIYEYGRIGEPDYAKAYEYYALAAALTDKSEAIYKLGDMYSRGRSVQRDMAKAARLWDRSLQTAQNPQEVAQPAIRLAPLYLEGSEDAGIAPDPLLALQLFQRSEIGLRIDIKNGLTYYSRRLEQAIEGQEKARLVLDALD